MSGVASNAPASVPHDTQKPNELNRSSIQTTRRNFLSGLSHVFCCGDTFSVAGLVPHLGRIMAEAMTIAGVQVLTWPIGSIWPHGTSVGVLFAEKFLHVMMRAPHQTDIPGTFFAHVT